MGLCVTIYTHTHARKLYSVYRMALGSLSCIHWGTLNIPLHKEVGGELGTLLYLKSGEEKNTNGFNPTFSLSVFQHSHQLSLVLWISFLLHAVHLRSRFVIAANRREI
jgi:hypothetical protein